MPSDAIILSGMQYINFLRFSVGSFFSRKKDIIFVGVAPTNIEKVFPVLGNPFLASHKEDWEENK